MTWEIKIEKANNGFICNFVDSDNTTKAVFNFEDNEKDLENLQEMLYSITEFFGIYASKHNKRNLYIEIKESK